MKNCFLFILVLFACLQSSASTFNQSGSLNQQQFKNCTNSTYPKIISKYEPGSIDAGKIDIQSNGDISLDDNVLIAINDGWMKASRANYLQNQNIIKDIVLGATAVVFESYRDRT